MDVGNMLNIMAITRPKMEITIHKVRNTIKKKNTLVRRLIYLEVISEMDLPSLRMEIINALKSCTAPMITEPRKTQRMAGSQPHIIAIAGPTIGPVPAIEVK
jgi:hypothetical protein